MTVQEVMQVFMHVNNYDGLCRPDCSCKLDNLMSCRKKAVDCQLARMDAEGELRPVGVETTNVPVEDETASGPDENDFD